MITNTPIETLFINGEYLPLIPTPFTLPTAVPISAFMAAQREWYDRQLGEAAGGGIRELTGAELEELGRCEWMWY